MTAPTSPKQQAPAINAQVSLLALPTEILGMVITQLDMRGFGAFMQVSKGALQCCMSSIATDKFNDMKLARDRIRVLRFVAPLCTQELRLPLTTYARLLTNDLRMCQLVDVSTELMRAVPRVRRSRDGMDPAAANAYVRAAVAKATNNWAPPKGTEDERGSPARPEDPAIAEARQSLQKLGFQGRPADRLPLDSNAMEVLARSRLVGPSPLRDLCTDVAERGQLPLMMVLLEEAPLFRAEEVHDKAGTFQNPHWTQWVDWIADADVIEENERVVAAMEEASRVIADASDIETDAASCDIMDEMLSEALAQVALEVVPHPSRDLPAVADAAVDPTANSEDVGSMIAAETMIATQAAKSTTEDSFHLELWDSEQAVVNDVLIPIVATSMMRAARRGHHAVLRLLTNDCRVAISDGNISDAICEAAQAAQAESACMLLERFHDRDAVCDASGKAVWIAAKAGHADVVDSLLRSRRFNARALGVALEFAAKGGDARVIARLITHRCIGDVGKVIRLVAPSRIEFDKDSHVGILIHPAKRGHEEIVRLLMGTPCFDGVHAVCALIAATENNQAAVVRLLLDNPLLQDGSFLQDRPLMIRIATIVCQGSLGLRLRRVDPLSFLEALLMQVAREGHVEILELLLVSRLFTQAINHADVFRIIVDRVLSSGNAALVDQLNASYPHFNAAMHTSSEAAAAAATSMEVDIHTRGEAQQETREN